MHKTKRMIFEKSMELFANKGYDSTSIEEITSVVGIAKGTFYYHFSSKEDMFKFIVEEGMKLLRNSIELKTKKIENSIDKIKEIVLIQIKVTLKYDDLVRVILSEMWGNDSRNLICRNCIEQYTQILERVVKEGMDKNEIAIADPATTAYGIFGVISSCIMLKQNSNKEIDADEAYKEFSKYIERLLN